jgi:hypothetical protein
LMHDRQYRKSGRHSEKLNASSAGWNCRSKHHGDRFPGQDWQLCYPALVPHQRRGADTLTLLTRSNHSLSTDVCLIRKTGPLFISVCDRLSRKRSAFMTCPPGWSGKSHSPT